MYSKVKPGDNSKAIQKYRELCADKKNFPVIGNSDAHKQEHLGKHVRMYVLAEELTQGEIMKAVLDRRCVIEWQRKFYGNEDYVSDVDLWYAENFIDHLRVCQQEVAPFI